jgi:hypothetical protein
MGAAAPKALPAVATAPVWEGESKLLRRFGSQEIYAGSAFGDINAGGDL